MGRTLGNAASTMWPRRERTDAWWRLSRRGGGLERDTRAASRDQWHQFGRPAAMSSMIPPLLCRVRGMRETPGAPPPITRACSPAPWSMSLRLTSMGLCWA